MKKILLSLLLVLLLLAGTVACGERAPAPPAPDEVLGEELQPIGQGETVFQFTVTDPDGVIMGWDVATDEETVGAALVAVGLIAGHEGEWGLMVTEVNGVTADWDADGAFWAFYMDGEFATAGVDATYIEAGVLYAFVYTTG
ncbi:MAG: DUF4430 domain-containing protein [Oscillospiraceae bacterium]|nr:DUF4430 domain-containing protein [Oscillospiraceae bacterium]